MIENNWSTAPKDLLINKNSVHVWSISLAQTQEKILELRKILSSDESARADRFYFDRDRNRFIVGRAMLRKILGRYLEMAPEKLIFSYGSHGKPKIENSPFNFNLSNSGDLALCGVTYQKEIGIDVEYLLRELKDAEAIAKRFFSAKESAEFLSLPPEERQLAFFRCWTRKEAYIKAIGDGLSYSLSKFNVTLTPEAKLLSVVTNPSEVDRWTLKELKPAKDYIAAIIVEGQDWQLNCWQTEV
ncbi:MAG: 4'-phosphopantetheinyl transferase superfamily protein [Blastocatellia bacterium]